MEKILLRNWNTLNENIPLDDSNEGKLERINLFKEIDVNNNGTLSINEIFIVLKEKLNVNDHHLKSSVFRAFEAIRLLRTDKSKITKEDHYLIFREFKRFLTYLRQYFEYHQMFEIIDSDDSKKIDIYEFEAALPFIKQWGMEINEPKKIFREIDDNDSGVITFDEFCYWAIQSSLKIPDEEEGE